MTFFIRSIPVETWGGLVGGDWRQQVQLSAVHQETDLVAEGLAMQWSVAFRSAFYKAENIYE